MGDPARSVNELLFDFFREVGRICLYHKEISLHKADKFYDKNEWSSIVPRDELVTDMTLDEFAGAQLSYTFKPLSVLPNATKLSVSSTMELGNEELVKTIVEKRNSVLALRREYIKYFSDVNKTSSSAPKKLAIGGKPATTTPKPSLEFGDIKPPVKQETIKSEIRILAEKLGIKCLTNNFDDCIRLIMDTYGDAKSKHHDIVSRFIVPYYLKYRRAQSTKDRNLIMHVIQTLLDNYISTGILPSDKDIEETKNELSNKDKYTPKIPKALNVMSYKERRNLLMAIIEAIAKKYGMNHYVVQDDYHLNDRMNEVVELYNKDVHDVRIDNILLPFIVESNV